jgi:ATP-dependent DNA ligase
VDANHIVDGTSARGEENCWAKLRMDTRTQTMNARFIPPMLLVRADSLPDDPRWLYQLKLDGYRVIAFKSGGKIHLRSRNNKDFSAR